MDFQKVDNRFELKLDSCSIEAYTDTDESSTVVLYRGGALRKITILNVTNLTDALIDACRTFKTFIQGDRELNKMFVSLIKEEWPKFGDEVIEPTYQNKELEYYKLEPRTLTALHKNKIYVRGDVPENLIAIRKLKGVGLKPAEEVFNKVIKTGPTKKIISKGSAGAVLTVDSKLPKNLKKILLKNTFHLIADIPREVKRLCKIDGIGKKKANQIVEILNAE